MTASAMPAEPILQRSCGLCGIVDDGPRAEIVTNEAAGRRVFFHLPGSPDCHVENADPRPDLDEDIALSQLRYAMTLDPTYPTPVDHEVLAAPLVVDCSDPAEHYRDPDDDTPRADLDLPEA